MDRAAIRAKIEAVVRPRAARGTTACPSEVARALAADWRPLMPLVREAAAEMAAEGLVIATQRGEPVDAVAARGPIRLSWVGPSDAGA